MKFAYEDLDVWNKAVDFAVQVIETVERISTNRKHYRLLEQIESSMPIRLTQVGALDYDSGRVRLPLDSVGVSASFT